VNARIRQEPLFVRDVKETPVRDTRLCGRRLGMPRIKVCVKMNDRDGPVDPVQRAENRENDRVVTAKASAAVSYGPKGVQKGDIRDYLWVLFVVLSKRTRRADHALSIGEGNVTL
jgi:hypothetical protein